MMKTELLAARLVLSQRQRRFEWQLARDEQTRAAGKLVAGKTHDLMNLIQIIQLAAGELEKRCDDVGRELVADLVRAGADAQHDLEAMMAVARPEAAVVRGAPVGPAVAAALATLRTAIAVDIHLATAPDTATRCTAEELEHLLIGLALDVADGPSSDPIELHVRERRINGAPWIEIVRASTYVPADERFELRAIEAIAARAGGELATSERRGGGEELVVALPVV